MSLIIPETSGSPYVYFSAEECIFEIKGNSFSNRINDVYEKVLDWIDEKLPFVTCDINFKLVFNISNSVTYKNILIMMTKLMKFRKEGKNINIIWYHHIGDEDSIAIGEDIKELFNIPVIFKKIK